MFSSNIHSLPSCSDYYGAMRVWERCKVPRNKDKWPEGTRPLDDTRKTHYAVIRDGDKIVFRLHQTNVVEWHNENSFLLDSCYDSSMTRQFAEMYLPSNIGFAHLKENGYVVNLYEQKFIRGRHTFEKKYNVWVCISETHKPKRRVLQRSKMREVQAATKPVCEWVKGIWAISGNDGSHPWLSKPNEMRSDVFCLDELTKPERMEAFVVSLLPYYWNNRTRYYGTFDAKQLVTKINEYFYNQQDCYISIDYDAPIPRD
jgi:hypothetical protein